MKCKLIISKIIVLASVAWIGVSLPSNAQTVINGTTVTTNALYVVGVSGTGNTLLVTNSGALYLTNSMYKLESIFGLSSLIGSNTGSVLNSVTVTGVGSVWTNAGLIAVGWRGYSNNLTISDGGRVENSYGHIGHNSSSSNNTVLVTGANSLWTNGNTLYVGYEGQNNSLTISDGARVDSFNGFIGITASSSNNTVLVTGANSLWTNRNAFGAGGQNNSLTISNGARVDNNYGYFSSNSAILVTGTDSQWLNWGRLHLGYYGQGNSLTISDGALVYNGEGSIGVPSISSIIGFNISSSNNTVLVTGIGSLLTNRNGLYLGYDGQNNSLTISNGARVDNLYGYIGVYDSSSNNTVLVTGTGSLLTNRSYLFVGGRGQNNSMTISEGARVDNLSGYIGDLSSNNTVLVTGTGSQWLNRSNLFVGSYGQNNSLNISDGGSVYATDIIVGMDTSSTNNLLTLSGTSSQLVVTNTVGTGVYDIRRGTNVQNGGIVRADRLIVTNVGSGVTGGVYLLNGGTTYVGQATISNGSVFQIGNGTDTAYFRQTQAGVTNTFANGIQINAGGSLSFAGTITNTLTLNGGSFAGTGTLTTALTVDNGSVIAPGNSPGNVNVATLTFGSLGTYAWEINNFTGTATNNWDFINVSGVLDITATAGSPFTLQLATLDAFNAPGLAQNWDMNVDQAWKILTAGSINGFAADKFSIDLSSFQNPIHPTGGFYVSQVGNELYLNYNHLATIPEPSTYALLTFLGTFFLFFAGKRRKSMTAAGNG